jgi:hypothetical protein
VTEVIHLTFADCLKQKVKSRVEESNIRHIFLQLSTVIKPNEQKKLQEWGNEH